MHITQNIIRKHKRMVLYIYTLLLKNQINTPYDDALYYLYKINYVLLILLKIWWVIIKFVIIVIIGLGWIGFIKV